MAETASLHNDRLELARSLVSHLERGADHDADDVLAELTGHSDSELFQQVGRLTRELHDSINSFVADARIADIAHNEIPDATERLRYVIDTTEQAANTTLGAVEDSLPLANSLRSDAHHLAEQWSKFNSRQLSVEDFRDLSGELSQFLAATQANSEELHNKLSEVLMAQGYQDLTGQVIRKVIDLVNDVEHKLVELVRLSGSHAKKDQAADAGKPDIKAQGPAIPGVDKGDHVNGQDDVDDLLSSLGF
jgi:chemotaxis protein CheZ